MESLPKKIHLTSLQALERLKKYCAYQERSQHEVRHKLLKLGQYGNDLENIIVKLIEDGFVNEERYAMAFARGKYRMKSWGRNKIIQQLKWKGISDYCVNKAMLQIGLDDYMLTLIKTLKKKAATLKDVSSFAQKQKLSSFLIRKGYEPEIVWEAVNEHFSR
ncbi:MAG: RecX family transcriptional regulator [Chitinophagales bacterium]|nr:RecX family transcriptional regulator [Chitinophagales bacterium]